MLADAIQDAGCDGADILAHCRGEGQHVRGCWVVDLVIGRELPAALLDGYYQGGPTYVENYLFLRLYPDGFWAFQDSFDPDFDFPAYLAAIEVDAIRRRYPRGHCLRNPTGGGWRYRCGRYTRQANAPLHDQYDEVVGRINDALVLTTWDEEEGDGLLWDVEVEGPDRLRVLGPYNDVCVFVPDRPAEPRAAADGGGM